MVTVSVPASQSRDSSSVGTASESVAGWLRPAGTTPSPELVTAVSASRGMPSMSVSPPRDPTRANASTGR